MLCDETLTSSVGISYLQKWALPNFFFHETTAYSIFRQMGVPVGKFDYLGLDMKPDSW